jgi:hypothetical protein
MQETDQENQPVSWDIMKKEHISLKTEWITRFS